MIDLSSIDELNKELSSAIVNLAPYHTRMNDFINYYTRSCFYPRREGTAPIASIPDNFLKIFADKNIEYTSEMPEFKVPGTPEDRENANIREKILYAVHRSSNTALLNREWAFDRTICSMAVSAVRSDFEKRCVYVERYDPRFCFWKRSNDNENRISAFWAVYPITKQEAMDRYGVTPSKNLLSMSNLVLTDPYFKQLDGQEWYIQATRFDDHFRVSWVGDKLIEEPHEHNIGSFPIDVDAPFLTREKNQFGAFYLEPMLTLQAELHETIRRRSNIVKRMSNPIVWGRNIKARTYDEVKAALKDAETGILGLGKDGDVGILQLQEIKMLYEHEAALKSDMQRLSGFAAASFGESVGANTSGEALGMYFAPTQKHVTKQYISTQAFMESINAKVLRAYDIMGRSDYGTGNTFNLTGYSPRSTILASQDGAMSYTSPGSYKVSFTSDNIAGDYTNRAIMPPVVPRNELAEKQAWAGWAKDKIISRTTAYEHIGIESPEDEKALLQLEMSEPVLNPDGISTLLGAQQNMLPSGQPQAPGAAAPQLNAPPLAIPAGASNGA
jgi:hypothetical protein